MTVLSTRDQITQIARGPGGAIRSRGGAPPPGGGMTGKDILRALRKRKWLVVLCVALFTAVAGVATALWLAYAPFYTAKAFLSVNEPVNIMERTQRLGYGPAIEEHKQSLIPLITSERVLTEAAKDRIKRCALAVGRQADDVGARQRRRRQPRQP